MYKIGLTLFLIITSLSQVKSQGKLLIVGGGSEKNGQSSWSTPAYRWAGEGKKVAIIGTYTGSLAPYFENQCGSVWAKEFAIDSYDSANSQITYDTLIAYDVIFFRGGDQYDYYLIYNDTKLQDAVNFVFNHGGTIGGTSAGMHILSSVIFTAENGTVYPYECIENPNNQYVTLASDFFDFVPSCIFDTHFAERGRFGRLVGFLANYHLNNEISIAGLGMDDMTCMTIEADGQGTVYGTGCANIYMDGSNYSQNGSKLLADTINIVQLLQGCTYNFVSGDAGFNGLDRAIYSSGFEETCNYTILASGSDLLSNNQAMLDDLVSNSGFPSENILLLSGDNEMASSYRTKLFELGAPQVNIFILNLASGNDTELGSKISAATKILFLKNSLSNFLPFLETTNGVLLQQRLKTDGMTSAFVGEDARLAGKTIVDNYLTEGASYYAELTFEKGLSLLRHTVVMPDTYLNSDIYENTATAVPYAMVLDTLKYGIWLTNHNYMKITPADEKTTLTGYGTAPVMIISNKGLKCGFSSQTSTGGAGNPRMVAGFEQMQLSLVDYSTPYVMGNTSPAYLREIIDNLKPLKIGYLSKDEIEINWQYSNYFWCLTDSSGRLLQSGKSDTEVVSINISSLKAGIYFVKALINQGSVSSSGKFIVY
jgi:cyanophycinase